MENIQENPMSIGEKIKNFFINPGKLFEETNKKHKFGVMLIIIGVVSLISTMVSYYFTKDYLIDIAINNAATKDPQSAEMYANTIKNYMNSPAGMIVTAVSAMVVLYIMIFFVTFIYYLGIRLFSGECTYKQVLSVYCISYITILISSVYEAVYSFINKAPSASQATTILQQFANSISILGLWQLVILVYGLSTISKVDKVKTTAIVLVVYVIGIGITVGTFAISHK